MVLDINDLRKELAREKDLLRFAEKQIRKAVPGFLSVEQGKRKKFYNWIQRTEGKVKKTSLSLQKPEERRMIQKLAGQSVRRHLVPLLKSNIKALERF